MIINMYKRNVINTIILSVIIIIALFIILHIYRYLSIPYDKYEILQQDIDKVNGEDMDKNPYPFIMTMIENDTLDYNINRYGIYSSLIISSKYETKKLEDFKKEPYYTHYHPLLYMKVNKDIDLTIIPQKYYNSENKEDNEKILIKLHPYNIIYIPRFSTWKLEGDNDTNVEIYYMNSPISIVASNIYKFMNKNNNTYVY